MAEHYTAHLKIEKIVKGSTIGTGNREVDGVTQITLKSQTLTGLVGKIRSHVAIITEE